MPLTTLPTQTDASLGGVKEDLVPPPNLVNYVPAAEHNLLVQNVVVLAQEVGLTDGTTAGSLRKAINEHGLQAAYDAGAALTLAPGTPLPPSLTLPADAVVYDALLLTINSAASLDGGGYHGVRVVKSGAIGGGNSSTNVPFEFVDSNGNSAWAISEVGAAGAAQFMSPGSLSLPGYGFTDGAGAPDLGTGVARTADDTVAIAGGGAEVGRFRAPSGSDPQMLVAGGSAPLPGLSWLGDSTKGLYDAGSNAIGLSIAGEEQVRFDNGGVSLAPRLKAIGGAGSIGEALYIEGTDTGTSQAGGLVVQGGLGPEGGTGGGVEFRGGGGQSGATNVKGGVALVAGGAGKGPSNGGDLFLDGGGVAGSGTRGVVRVGTVAASAIVSGNGTTNPTWTHTGDLAIAGSGNQLQLATSGMSASNPSLLLAGGVGFWVSAGVVRLTLSSADAYRFEPTAFRPAAAGAGPDLGSTTARWANNYSDFFLADDVTGGAANPPHSFRSRSDQGMYSIDADTAGASAGGIEVFRWRAPSGANPQMLVQSGSASAPSIGLASTPTTGIYGPSGNSVAVSIAGTRRLWVTAAVTRVESTQFQVPDGTAAAPPVTFTSDSTKGIYDGGANALGFSTGGLARMTLDNTALDLSVALTGTITNAAADQWTIDASAYQQTDTLFPVNPSWDPATGISAIEMECHVNGGGILFWNDDFETQFTKIGINGIIGLNTFDQWTLQGADGPSTTGKSGGDVGVRGGHGDGAGGGGTLLLEGGDSGSGQAGSVDIRGGNSSSGTDGDVDIGLATTPNVRLGASGTNLGFFGATPVARPAAYTPSNVTTTRTYDADSTSTAELADVLGTLISDLQSLGLIG